MLHCDNSKPNEHVRDWRKQKPHIRHWCCEVVIAIHPTQPLWIEVRGGDDHEELGICIPEDFKTDKSKRLENRQWHLQGMAIERPMNEEGWYYKTTTTTTTTEELPLAKQSRPQQSTSLPRLSTELWFPSPTDFILYLHTNHGPFWWWLYQLLHFSKCRKWATNEVAN